MIDLNPALLRTYLSVSRHLSHTRAAEELALSQPAVSRQIQRLEREIGTRLIEQIGKNLHLTPAGEMLVHEAERLLGEGERLVERVRAEAGPTRGTLRVGASTTPGFHVLPPVIGRFHTQYPDVELHYEVTNTQRIERALLNNDLDLGFVGRRPGNPDLVAELWIEDDIVVFASENHPLSALSTVEPIELTQHLAVTREHGSATRELFECELADRGIELTRRLEVQCPELIRTLVASGLGFSYFSRRGLERDPVDPRVRILPVAVDLKRPILIVRHKKKHLAPTMEEFLGMARDVK